MRWSDGNPNTKSQSYQSRRLLLPQTLNLTRHSFWEGDGTTSNGKRNAFHMAVVAKTKLQFRLLGLLTPKKKKKCAKMKAPKQTALI
jgi:hypothetical protein